jgi:hypothetical protein
MTLAGWDMKRFTTFLIGALLIAWMAYLSWPATADLPVRSPIVEPTVPVKLHVPSPPPQAPSYQVQEMTPKCTDSSV